MDQQTLLRASTLEQSYTQTEQQLEFINTQINELEHFEQNLRSFDLSTETAMLASLGKGVYIPVSLTEKKLFVEVGSGVLVNKTPQEASAIIELQIKKFVEVRASLIMQLESIGQELSTLIEQVEAKK